MSNLEIDVVGFPNNQIHDISPKKLHYIRRSQKTRSLQASPILSLLLVNLLYIFPGSVGASDPQFEAAAVDFRVFLDLPQAHMQIAGRSEPPTQARPRNFNALWLFPFFKWGFDMKMGMSRLSSWS